MLIFIVPIKSSKLASDWSEFSKLVERTLKSICNQNSQNFKVVVACHELPNISYQNNKIEYIQVDFDPPQLVEDDWDKNRELKEGDKARKILVGFKKAKSYNPDYVMVVDSDDLISNNIVSFVEKHNDDISGWYFPKGYFYKEGAKYLFLNKENFNIRCGSCIIIKTELFPQLIINDPWLYYFHETMILPDGKPLDKFPFAGTLYSMANGENHFMTAQKAFKEATSQRASVGQFIRSLQSKMLKYGIKPITPNFKRKFNFYRV
jgi:hypothetical protein